MLALRVMLILFWHIYSCHTYYVGCFISGFLLPQPYIHIIHIWCKSFGFYALPTISLYHTVAEDFCSILQKIILLGSIYMVEKCKGIYWILANGKCKLFLQKYWPNKSFGSVRDCVLLEACWVDQILSF